MARHLERIRWSPNPSRPPEASAWPFTIPAVAQLQAEGAWEVPDGIAFLVGENGSGKSTLVEAMAAAYPRRGHESAMVDAVGPVESPEDSPLRWHLRADTAPMASPAGFFLRAELMHGWLARTPAPRGVAVGYNQRSHGESFLAIIRDRFADVGVYFMDEPEAALSFTSSLGLLALLGEMAEEGSQVIVATHSPLLVALPGATIWEVGEWGRREVAYADCDLVRLWRAFLDAPERFTRHL
ncbi:AAA family ATPase [soil metagenome]